MGETEYFFLSLTNIHDESDWLTQRKPIFTVLKISRWMKATAAEVSGFQET